MTITLEIKPEQAQHLSREAATVGVSEAELLREFVAHRWGGESTPVPSAGAASKAAAERLAELDAAEAELDALDAEEGHPALNPRDLSREAMYEDRL